jgi:hypothetical protein
VSPKCASAAPGNDANLSDFGAQVICLLAFFAWRAKNPAEKAFWFVALVVTLVAVLSTGNRGGFLGLAIAMGYGLYLFRRQLGFQRLVLIICAGLAVIVGANWYLSNYTYATSPIERLLHTQMVGMVPETRTMTWWPSIQKSMQHPFVGHGPFFEIGEGLTFQFWPHNAYLYYLQTIGLIGLGAFLWIMTRVWKNVVGLPRVWKAARRGRRPACPPARVPRGVRRAAAAQRPPEQRHLPVPSVVHLRDHHGGVPPEPPSTPGTRGGGSRGSEPASTAGSGRSSALTRHPRRC